MTRHEPLELKVLGEHVVLLPERALYLPAEDALIVADLHWGKAASFRAANVPVPTGTTAHDLARLDQALTITKARRLIVLGDLLHARAGRQPGTLRAISEWRDRHRRLDIVLVRGNHDRRAGDPPIDLHVECVDAPWQLGVFTCVHDPDEVPDALTGYALAGHLHPNVRLNGRAWQHVRLPCFVFGNQLGILPAFSSFTGGGMYEYAPDDRLFAIVEGEVLRVEVAPARKPRRLPTASDRA